MNKETMFKLTYGLYVLTCRDGKKDNGCIINTAGQVTAEPERISITVNKTNVTHDMLKKTGECNLSILSQNVPFEIIKRFGFQSGREVEKLKDFTGYERSSNGIAYVTEGVNGYISGKVVQTMDLGSHTLYIADVTDMEILSQIPSVTYEYYFEHIKPKPQKKEDGTQTVWRCKICGYEYVGEELPEDFICPLCKHPASDFEKVS